MLTILQTIFLYPVEKWKKLPGVRKSLKVFLFQISDLRTVRTTLPLESRYLLTLARYTVLPFSKSFTPFICRLRIPREIGFIYSNESEPINQTQLSSVEPIFLSHLTVQQFSLRCRSLGLRRRRRRSQEHQNQQPSLRPHRDERVHCKLVLRLLLPFPPSTG